MRDPFADLRPTAWHRVKALWLHVSDRHPEAVGVALALLFCAAIFGLAEVVHHAGLNPFEVGE